MSRSSPKGLEQRVRIELRRQPTRIAVVADTHSQPHARAFEHLRALEPEAILHGGDIGDRKVLARLADIAPVYAVRGNIDAHERDLPDTLVIDLVDTTRAMTRILLTHIAVAGPKLRTDVAVHARREEAALVVCGHSHMPFLGRDKGLVVFNPGSIGPRRFMLPIVFGTLEVTSTGLTLQHHDCETGRPWSPG